MAIVLPHVFQDNVNESASGVQVNENFNVLKAAIEALEALSPSLLHKPTAGTHGERALSTLFKESTTRDALVLATVTTAGPGFAVEIIVGGQRKSLLQETVAGCAAATFIVPANQEWQAKLNTGNTMTLEVDVVLL